MDENDQKNESPGMKMEMITDEAEDAPVESETNPTNEDKPVKQKRLRRRVRRRPITQ